MERQNGAIRAALIWGALWGFWEATAGHLVHLIKIPGLPGIHHVPAALFFMSRAFARSGRLESIFLAACVAAGIKLATILLIPGHNFAQAALNPALAILPKRWPSPGCLRVSFLPSKPSHYLRTKELILASPTKNDERCRPDQEKARVGADEAALVPRLELVLRRRRALQG